MGESTKSESTSYSPIWVKVILFVAAAYNAVVGLLLLSKPSNFFHMVGMGTPSHIQAWGSIGMVFIVFALAYGLAGTNPTKHWGIVLVGILWNVLVPAAFSRVLFGDPFTQLATFTILFNSLVWWFPLGAVLYITAKDRFQELYAYRYREPMPIRTALEVYSSSKGMGLYEASKKQPLLLVFIPQFGCPWTRRTLRDLKEQSAQLTSFGVVPIVAHMAEPATARRRLIRSGMPDAIAVSDARCELYRAFGLGKAEGFKQVAAPKLWWQVAKSAIFQGLGFGSRLGDIWQMPGVFLVSKGKVLWGFRHSSLTDRVSYTQLVINSGLAKKSSTKAA